MAEKYTGLAAEQRLIYAIVAIATDLRHYLQKDEILMAAGDLSNTALYALERLVARRLLDAPFGRHRLRHRRIAELVAARLRGGAELFEPYRGLLRAMATRYNPNHFRSRETRLLIALISHRRIGHSFAVSDARALYQEIEELCRDDYHYWLQRGSFEVQFGNLSLARTSLAQARVGDGAKDFRVDSEWAYYLIKSAWKDPRAAGAEDRVREGEQILLEQIEVYGEEDSHTFHIYGSQMLAWLRRAPLSRDDRARQLEAVKDRMEEAVRLHPGQRDLTILLHDVTNDWLKTAIE